MEYYESYFDEALDEELSEDMDELFEDLGESGDLAEGGESRREKRRMRQDGRRNRRRDRQDRRRGGGKPAKAPVSTGAVQNAFDNVGQDMAGMKKEVKNAELRQSHEQMNDLFATILFRPTLETAKLAIVNVDAQGVKINAPTTTSKQMITLTDKDGKFIDKNGVIITDDKPLQAEVGYKLNDNLISLLLLKFIGNIKGVDTSKGFQQWFPLIGAVAASNSVRKQLGLDGLLGSGTNTNTAGNTGLGNLTSSPALLLLLALVFMKK